MCCDLQDATASDGPEGECEDCGGTTYGGISDSICGYSPVTCETCGSRICDMSC